MSLKYTNRKKKVDIIVFRTNKTGTSILWSKPCINCVKSVYNTLNKKNYRLKKFYYINQFGQVEYYTSSTLPIL